MAGTLNLTKLQHKFLKGAGELDFQSNPEFARLVAQNKPLTKSVREALEASVELGVSKGFRMLAPSKDLTLSLVAGASTGLYFHWPGQAGPGAVKDDLETYGMPAPASSEYYAEWIVSGQASGSATAKFAKGPLTATLGFKAGGSTRTLMLKQFPADTGARTMLETMVKRARLPHSIDAENLPMAGEAYALEYGGYLKLSGDLQWGFSYAGSKGLDVGSLKLTEKHSLALAGKLSFAYAVGGDFRLGVRRGASDGWVRVMVHKARQSQFDLFLDLGAKAAFSVEGLPESGEQFLATLLGVRGKDFLEKLRLVSEVSSVEELREKLKSEALNKYVDKLSERWLGAVLDNNEKLDDFLGHVNRILEEYDRMGDRLVAILEPYVGRLQELTPILDVIVGLPDVEALEPVTDSRVYGVLRQLSELGLMDLLLGNERATEELKRIQKVARKLKELIAGGWAEKVTDLVDQAKSQFPLNDLFKELKRYKTGKDIREKGTEEAKELLGRLVDKAFEQLDTKEVNKALKTASQIADRLRGGFYDELNEKLQQHLKRGFEFNLNYHYQRANARTALLDVEFNLETTEGAKAYERALRADFSGMLQGAARDWLRLHRGLFTHKLQESSELKVNVLGWKGRWLEKVILDTEHTISESENGGLLHVFAINTAALKERETPGELMRQKMMFGYLARSLQASGQPDSVVRANEDWLVETLHGLSAGYEFAVEDDKVKDAEMNEYLLLAEEVGLIPDAAAYLKTLKQEFPQGFGKVTAKYLVSFDPAAFESIFLREPPEVEAAIRGAMRRVIRATYVRAEKGYGLHDAGLAYNSEVNHREWRRLGEPTFITRAVPVPGSARPLDPHTNRGKHLIRVVAKLFLAEESFVEAYSRLDELVDALRAKTESREGGLRELETAAWKFAKIPNQVEQWALAPNTFFAVFDQLVTATFDKPGARQASLLLEFEPEKDKKSVRFLTTAA